MTSVVRSRRVNSEADTLFRFSRSLKALFSSRSANQEVFGRAAGERARERDIVEGERLSGSRFDEAFLRRRLHCWKWSYVHR